ncbi:MAG: hypothetical protein LBB88_11955, partial [Planctomycetaceae bacterium]|nr:hypothetical protein [Planctomycetaceae bacterium]
VKTKDDIKDKDCNKRRGCKPCIPPVGSHIVLRIDASGTHPHGSHNISTGHIHYKIVNQTPYPECKCIENYSGKNTISGTNIPTRKLLSRWYKTSWRR